MDAPIVLLYVPPAHDVHAVVDVVSVLYVPAAHWTHEGKLVYVPAPQEEQTATDEAPATELNRPALHEVHAVVPVVSALYEPARHAVQPEVPVVSALYAPAAHAVHTVGVLAEATLPKAPAAHGAQPAVPVVSEL